MEYRIVELDAPTRDITAGREVKRFESAYDGMEALRAAVLRRDQHAQRWYLVDGAGRVLLEPADVYDLAG